MRLKLSKREIAEWEQRDRESAAMHEAGHFVVCEYFQVPVRAQCWKMPGGFSAETRSYVGSVGSLQTTPFRQSVIGWAGMLAEAMHQRDYDWTEGIDNLENWYC